MGGFEQAGLCPCKGTLERLFCETEKRNREALLYTAAHEQAMAWGSHLERVVHALSSHNMGLVMTCHELRNELTEAYHRIDKLERERGR